MEDTDLCNNKEKSQKNFQYVRLESIIRRQPAQKSPPSDKVTSLYTKDLSCYGIPRDEGIHPRSLTANAPEKWWLEDDFPIDNY